MLLFDIVFNGNDSMYAEAEQAVNEAIAKYGEDKAVGFPDTAYTLACYYAETGTKITNLKEAKEALTYIKSIMTRERRLHDGFMSVSYTHLLTGQDLYRQLAKKDLGEKLLLSCNMFRMGEDVFLDDMTAVSYTHLDQKEKKYEKNTGDTGRV